MSFSAVVSSIIGPKQDVAMDLQKIRSSSLKQ